MPARYRQFFVSFLNVFKSVSPLYLSYNHLPSLPLATITFIVKKKQQHNSIFKIISYSHAPWCCKVAASVLEKQTIDTFCVLFVHLPHASQASVSSSVVTSSVTIKQCTLIFCNTNQHVPLVGRTRSGSISARLASIVYMVCGECCQ